jgi:poly-gamma-glutamate synthesis protein (capsule biosynthesis protein)
MGMEEKALPQEGKKPYLSLKTFKAAVLLVLLSLLLSLGINAVYYQILTQAVWHPVSVQPVRAEVAEPRHDAVKIIAVGDVMLSRKVGRYMDQFGLDYPFAKIKDTLLAGDIVFGNLESPIGIRGTPLPGKGIWFRAKPEAVHALKEAGFHIMSIANNHALDYDTPNFLETIEILTGAGIHSVGGGKNISEARKPVIIEKKDVSVGFLAYSDMAEIFWSFQFPRMLRATDVEPGIAPLRLEEMLEDVQNLRPQVDLLVVSLHWGVEYTDNPTSAQRDMAHALAEAGVDVILGHHPHTLQGVEVYNNTLIVYSMGNFVFDQTRRQVTQEGLLVELEVSKTGIEKAWIVPVYLPECQPRVAVGIDADRILEKTARLSANLGTSLRLSSGRAEVLAMSAD